MKSTLASAGVQVSFAPAFTSYRDPSLASSLLSTFPSIDGFFNWWSCGSLIFSIVLSVARLKRTYRAG